VLYDVVKQELANAVTVANLPDLDAYPFTPSEPHPPCFYAGEVVIDPNKSFGPTPGGHDEADIICRLLVGAADDADGQKALDRYISRSGPYSIRVALLAARGAPGAFALNGAADDFAITRIDGYRMIPGPNGVAYFGAQITIRVIGSNS
jgi:hypothetical protein